MSAGTKLYELEVSKLQSGIEVGKNTITGTLMYVTDYTGFSGDTSEQEGNFLALSLAAEDGVTITTELVNGKGLGPVTVTDGFCVYRITNPSTQIIKITFTKSDTIETKSYTLSGLICNEE